MECLNQWRHTSKKESRYFPPSRGGLGSFFRCDECRHEYSFRINSAYLLTTRRMSCEMKVTVAVQTALTLAIFTGTAFTLGSLIKLVLFFSKTQVSIHPQTMSIPRSTPIILSAPATLKDVFNYRDPTHWMFGMTTLGIVGFTQMLFGGGMIINLGDIYGMRRIWGGREGDRAEIRIGGFFGGGILWVLMIIVGLGKSIFLSHSR